MFGWQALPRRDSVQVPFSHVLTRPGRILPLCLLIGGKFARHALRWKSSCASRGGPCCGLHRFIGQHCTAGHARRERETHREHQAAPVRSDWGFFILLETMKALFIARREKLTASLSYYFFMVWLISSPLISRRKTLYSCYLMTLSDDLKVRYVFLKYGDGFLKSVTGRVKG